jgi:hypothetical protein
MKLLTYAARDASALNRALAIHDPVLQIADPNFISDSDLVAAPGDVVPIIAWSGIRPALAPARWGWSDFVDGERQPLQLAGANWQARCLVPVRGMELREGELIQHASAGECLFVAGVFRSEAWRPSTFRVLITGDNAPAFIAPQHWAAWLSPAGDARNLLTRCAESVVAHCGMSEAA